MDEHERLAARFEAERGRLQAVAYRMPGSAGEAEDAVQEAWLRLERVDGAMVDNLGGWLRTVVTRICLDMLRSRRARHKDLTEQHLLDRVPHAATDRTAAGAPEAHALRTEAVGNALLVVLDRLTPSERVAFVLHDMFAVPFDEIAPIVERSPDTAKKLASRARSNGAHGEWQSANGAAPGQFAEEAGTRGYANLIASVPGLTNYHNDQTVATYGYTGQNGQWWSFDDTWSIGRKAAYIKSRHLLGAMIWEMSGDTANGSLFGALVSGLQN